MKCYLVGGAVRDELMGRAIKEKDWVIVGSTPEEMLALGFKPVGKDFPVFLHPETKEEYALARTERKVAPGYKGFIFHAEPGVSLEEDLIRRDLTINAIAKDTHGNLFDPFHGQQDITAKILRHVSPAFKEDPVRILRLARFAARFSNFTVAPETLDLMKEMVKNGEVKALVAERVWQECYKAMQEVTPARFFEVLRDCHAINIIFPHLSHLDECLQLLNHASNISTNPAIRFAAFCYPISESSAFWRDLRAPVEFSDLSLMLKNLAPEFSNISLQDSEAIMNLFEKGDAYRRPERFADLLLLLTIISTHFSTTYINILLSLVEKSKKIPDSLIETYRANPSTIQNKIREYRINMINELTKSLLS